MMPNGNNPGPGNIMPGSPGNMMQGSPFMHGNWHPMGGSPGPGHMPQGPQGMPGWQPHHSGGGQNTPWQNAPWMNASNAPIATVGFERSLDM